jgi:peptide deformylase
MDNPSMLLDLVPLAAYLLVPYLPLVPSSLLFLSSPLACRQFSKYKNIHIPTILDVADDSEPLLRTVSEAVDPREFNTDALNGTVADMIKTMYYAKGIGLAAPQVRIMKRMMVFYLPAARDEAQVGVPLTVLINPEMEVIDTQSIVDYEGCLSVPGMRGKVARYKSIKYKGYSEKGELVERVAHGWHARLFQHEFDHLNGILYPGLMAEEDKLLTVDEWRRANNIAVPPTATTTTTTTSSIRNAPWFLIVENSCCVLFCFILSKYGANASLKF